MIRRLFMAFKNRKRKERSKRYRYTMRVLNTVCIAYGVLIVFPHPLFAHSVQVGQFSIYSDRPIPPEIETVVDLATARLSASPLYSSTDSFHVFIAEDRWRRVLLMPHSPGAFGVSMVLTGNTVLNRCDIANDLSWNDQPKFNRRPMHTVLAHESMHQIMRRKLGLLTYLRLPTWKNEGYCEYIAEHPSFDIDQGVKLVRSGKVDGHPAFRYLTYLFAVRDCLDNQKLQPRELFSQPLDFQTSLDSYVATRSDGG